jgi:hypothetical protein
MARRGGDHGARVDELIVREEREEEEKGGTPWGPVVVVSSLTSAGIGVALAER